MQIQSKMKGFILVVGVFACFLATVGSHNVDRSVTAVKDNGPCGDYYPQYAFCIFTEGIARMILDPKRRDDIIHDGVPRLIKNLREILSHTGELLPAIGAIGLDIGFHFFNIVDEFLDGLSDTINWWGTRHEWREYVEPLVEMFKQSVLNIKYSFIGGWIGVGKSGPIGERIINTIKVVVNTIKEILEVADRFIETLIDTFADTAVGRFLKKIIIKIKEWIAQHGHFECEHWFPGVVCEAATLIMKAVMKVVDAVVERVEEVLVGLIDEYWYVVGAIRDVNLAAIATLRRYLDRFTFPDVVPFMVGICKIVLPSDICEGFQGVAMSIDRLAIREIIKMKVAMREFGDWLDQHVFIDVNKLM